MKKAISLNDEPAGYGKCAVLSCQQRPIIFAERSTAPQVKDSPSGLMGYQIIQYGTRMIAPVCAEHFTTLGETR